MTKVKSNGKGRDQSLNKPSKVVKDNPIKKNKNKNNKFAKTMAGKVNLMDDKKAENNQNNLNKFNNKQKQKKNSSEAPVNNNNASQQKNKKKSNKQFVKDNKNLASKKNKPDESLDETNEDVTACDSSSSISANDNNINIQDILGKSLADSTDEDDTDFVEDEEPDEDEYEYNSDIDNSASLNKGVKMFKGITKNDNDSSDEFEDDYESDEDLDDELDIKSNTKQKSISKALNKDTNNINNKSNISTKKNKGKVEEDDDDDDDDDEEEDDEDFNLNDDDEDDEDDVDDDDDEEDEDEDDDDDDDEEDEEEEETGPGLKDLLASSIATDDDDDEDFKEEGQDDEDIDISDESDSEVVKKNNKKQVSNISNENDEQSESADASETDSRTIFISNIPKEVTKEEIRKLFKKFGEIESIRERGIIPIDSKTSKKVAAIKKQIHPKIETVLMFIVYKLNEGAKKATSMNGKQLKGNYLKVDIVDKNLRNKPDEKKAVFLGNLPYTIHDNDLWEHFKPCGEIHSVRLIRNKKLGVGKGIGYINFQNEDSVSLALELNGSTLLNREIRVKRCSVNDQKEKKLTNKNKRSLPIKKKVKSNKKFKSSDTDETTPTESNKKKLKTKNKLQKNNSPNASEKIAATTFQGQKATAEKNKKKKKSKPKQNLLKA